jgi:hypothetical protein
MEAFRKTLRWTICSTIVLLFATPLQAVNNRIEPDDYAEGTVLNDIHALVDLRIYDGVLRPNFPTDFGVFPDPTIATVTANQNPDIFGGYYTSTGTKTFGHSDIPFFSESRQLAMKFLAPTSQVTIDFIGRNSLASEIGVLQVYSAQGTLLDTFTSAPVFAHQVATLSITRPLKDIGYARAHSSPTADPFGTLDNLRFVTNLNGDFNSNGVVDAADYAVWRKGLGPTYSQSDYQLWRQNFGAGSGSGGGTQSAVPEPAAAVLVMLLALAGIARQPGHRLRRSTI